MCFHLNPPPSSTVDVTKLFTHGVSDTGRGWYGVVSGIHLIVVIPFFLKYWDAS